MICKVENCERLFPKVYRTQGFCSYHYRLKNEGQDIDTYNIRDKTEKGLGLEAIKDAIKMNTDLCVLWRFGKDGKGYGAIYYNKKRYKAHRVTLMLYTDRDPDSKIFACHKCDVTLCINPRHLYWGDSVTNARDRELFAYRRNNKERY